MITREQNGVVTCPVCGHSCMVAWDNVGGESPCVVPILSDPCLHLKGAEWDGTPGSAEFYACEEDRI